MPRKKKSSDPFQSEIPQYRNLPIAVSEAFYLPVERGLHVIGNLLSTLKRQHSWQGPAGILFTLLLTFPTTTFKETFTIKAEVWQALVILVGILALIAFVRALYYLFQNRKITPESIVKQLQGNNGSEDAE